MAAPPTIGPCWAPAADQQHAENCSCELVPKNSFLFDVNVRCTTKYGKAAQVDELLAKGVFNFSHLVESGDARR
jgi:hypothetical protein